jgi:hypothetical protein
MAELTLEALAARLEAVERTLAALLQAQQPPPANAAASIPGVSPADIWEADAQADAGQLTPHADVFAKLRRRP